MNKTNVMRILQTAHIPFNAFEYDTAKGVDALSVAGYLNKDPHRIFKTLVAVAPTHEHFVFVVPATAELDLKKAARAAGVKNVEMIPLKKLLPTTGYIHGGCSPVGMKKNFATFIDKSAESLDMFCISGGKIGTTVELNAGELARFIKAGFADLVAD